jgi:hypothetical protein
MTGRLFHDSDCVGVIPGKNVAVGVRDCKGIGLGFGLGVRDGAVTGICTCVDASRYIVIFTGDCVGVEMGCVGEGRVASAAQAVSTTQNTKWSIRFIRLSISVKN